MFKRIMAIIIVLSIMLLTIPLNANEFHPDRTSWFVIPTACTHPTICRGYCTGSESITCRVSSSIYNTLTVEDGPALSGKHVCTFTGWASTYENAKNGIEKYRVGDQVNSYSFINTVTHWAVYETPKAFTSQTSNVKTSWVPPSQKRFFEFTPTTTATYVFTSSGSKDTYGYIYSSDLSELEHDDDDGDGSNFLIERKLYAGTKYYLGGRWYNSSYDGDMTFVLKRQYNISYNANGGSGAPSSQTKLHGNAISLSNLVPANGDRQFMGWSTDSSATSAEYLPGDTFSTNADTTLYAVWGYPTGSCGENVTWTIFENNLYINGTGDMYDYASPSNVPWVNYINSINRIKIYDGITSIGDYAFAGCNNVAEAIVPDSVTDIGKYAFSGCTMLPTVNIPSGITTIEPYTFNGCSSLTGPELPDTLTSIGEYAFHGCSSIKSITLPDSVNSIGEYAFAGCSDMESINIPSGITTIEAYAFSENRSLAEIIIPDTVAVIKEYAFSGCSSFSSVIIPDSVTEIQRAAFFNCPSLISITIPYSVTTLGTSLISNSSDTIIKCHLNSAAHLYAVEEDYSYEIISRGELEKPTFKQINSTGSISVEISAPMGAIYYTTNGTDPVVHKNNLYKNPISLKNNATIKAIAVAEGWDNSPVAELSTNLNRVKAPYSNVPSGKVLAGTKIKLYCDTDDAEIWCTTDKSIPTESDVYTCEIEITESTTIHAFAVKDGMLNSELVTFNYDLSSAEDVPLVTTLPATDITETSAKLSAQVNANNGDIYMVGFIYFEKNNSNAKYFIEADDSYSAVVSGLNPNTEYWYQAHALNELGISPPGHIEIFKTDAQGIIKPTSIGINPSYIKMNLGKKKTLLATVLPMAADSRDVYWSSEDTSVATVDENGVVTAVGLGNTRIKATTVSNRLVAYCNIDVISSELQGEFDFSENHMITNSSFHDEHGYDYAPEKGGNALMASAYLARWDGAVLEENDMYPYPSKPENIKYNGDIVSDYHVQNIIYLPYRKNSLDNNEIKNAIMKYGAVYSSFKIGLENDLKTHKFFNETKSTYHYPEGTNSFQDGHAIAIVGWDDNYPRINFDVIPPGDGAFICKNSWGTSVGEDGYFYISYYDKYLGKYVERVHTDYNAVFYNVESSDNYNKIYQYDYLGPVLPYEKAMKKIYTANVFPESGKSLQQTEVLKAVSFYVYAQGTPYEIYIVTDYKDTKSFSEISAPIKTGVAEYAGYYTIDLDTPVELKQGTRFAVVVKFSSPTKDPVYTFIEAPLPSDLPHSSNARANSGESFVGMDKKTWIDLTDDYPNANLCIKAFTETEDSAVLLQGIDNLGREYENETDCYTLEEFREKGFRINEGFIDYLKNDSVELFSSDDDYNLGSIPPSFVPDLNTNHNYSEGAELPAKYDLREEECMTSVKDQGLIGSCWAFATYASMESALKKASFLSRGGSGNGLNQAPGNASSIELNTTGTMLALENTLQLEASVYPYDSTTNLIWKSSNNGILTVSAQGLVRALGIGKATVTVSTGDGETSAECAITVTRPENVESIAINNTESQIVAGDKLLIDYSVYPENAGNKDIFWEVNDTSVASINKFGLLSAKSGGTVTVTAYSSDGSVSDSFTIEIDDGCECNIEITDNNLSVYDTNIFGSLSANITNKTSYTIDTSVVMAIYDSSGKMVKILSEDIELAEGDNPVEFKNVYISGLTDTKFKIKIFVWDNNNNLRPISTLRKDTIE